MLKKMMTLVRDEEGQGMAEYGLILAGVAVVVMIVIFTLGEEITAVFQQVIDKFLENKPEEAGD